jgi:hypothetical protein
MRLRTILLPLALALAFVGCAGRSGPPSPPDPDETPPTTKDPGAVEDERPLQPAPAPGSEGAPGEPQKSAEPDGTPCLSGTECASGICEGEGCTDDRPGVCAPRSRACTRDLRQYCGCDGKTFGASGTCPGRRFAARAQCAA